MVARLNNWIDSEIEIYTNEFALTNNEEFYKVVKELRNVKECVEDLIYNRQDSIKMTLAKSFLYGKSEQEHDKSKVYRRLYFIVSSWHNKKMSNR